MGAMAPPPWTPKDDMLLKNSVEAGASLESLAKGAVQFSQRYSLQELQDRWSSLLYDPVISLEAGAHMVEIERSALKPTKTEIVKELAGNPGKRKNDSIRKCYYARRKRICNEPFDMMGVNLLSRHDQPLIGEANYQPADCGISNSIAHDFGIQGPEFGIGHQPISELVSHAGECIPPFSMAQNHKQEFHFDGKNLSYAFEKDLSPVVNQTDVPGFDQSKHLPLSNVYENEDIEDNGNTCLELGGPSFHSFGSSSPLPQMPVWTTSPDIDVTNFPIQNVENDQHAGDTFLMPEVGDMNDTEVFRCDGAGPSTNLKASISCDDMTTEDYFTELTHTLFDFTNDEEFLLLDNAKEALDRSYLDGLSSLLLDSPNRGELPDANPDEIAGAGDGHLVPTSVEHFGVLDNRELHLSCEPKVPDAQVTAASTSKLGPEYRNGAICCAFNMEDPEIPSNDDVFLPFRCPSPLNSSGMPWRMQEPGYLMSSSPMDFMGAQKAKNAGPPVVQNHPKGLCRPSRVLESLQPLDKAYPNFLIKSPIRDQTVKFELPKSSIHHAAVRNAKIRGFPNHISSANAAANNAIGPSVRLSDWEISREKGLDCKCSHGHEYLQIIQSNSGPSNRNELEAKQDTQKDGLSNIDLTSQNAVVQNPSDKSLVLDEDEQYSENDFDVPNFSDVEAMILDMDLNPDELDIYTNPEVQQYQHEETKRTIIRLEQAANSCMQRTISSHGAYAFLYGRYSKFFLKKPKVSLGRATADIAVDIDLGREKNGSKISRRQATVNLDAQGVFHLKNLGKGSIYVNGQDVKSGESTILSSGCLIQIKSLVYVFETNKTLIKQYVDTMASQGGNLSSDHKPLLMN